MEYAFSEIGIKPKEFWQMTWGEFSQVCLYKEREKIEKWRHTRLILAAHLRKNPEEIFPLPGEQNKWEDIEPVKTQEEIHKELTRLNLNLPEHIAKEFRIN